MDHDQQIHNQSENDNIPEEPKQLRLLLLLFEFNTFSFLKDIIYSIIYMSISCDQNSHQWQCSMVT